MKPSIRISASLIALLAISAQSATATSATHTLHPHALNVNSQQALVNKVSECTSMIRVINQTVAEAKAATNFGSNGDVQMIEKLVMIFGKASKDLNSLNVSDEKLKTYKSQFLIMYQRASANSKQLAISVKKRRSVKISDGLRKSKNIFSPEQDLTKGLNIYCNS
jgi:hypothetical protein